VSLSDARESMLDAMRGARGEVRGAITGRKSNRKIEIYHKMTPEMLDKVAERYGMDATIEYVMAMEKEAAGNGD
jgi:hypothetical protein